MATLNSPGVAVTVVNESFYTPAAPGTVPLIVVASASNKKNPSGVTAPGTTTANNGKVWLLTGQRDLADTFGTPIFYTDAQNNPVNGGELNEYGLQAAYSLLGVSSAAYVVRAPIDLGSLLAKTSAPTGAPADGAYWLDTSNTLYGVFEWDSTKRVFTNKTPLVIDDSTAASKFDAVNKKPNQSQGTVGQYAVTANLPAFESHVFYKNSNGNWVEVGSINEDNFTGGTSDTFVSTVWSTSWPAATGKAIASVTTSSGTLTLNTIAITVPASWTPSSVATLINTAAQTAGVGAKVIGTKLAIFADYNAKSNGSTEDGKVAISGDAALLAELGLTAKTYLGPTVFVGPHTAHPDFTTQPTGSVYVKTTSPNAGANWVVKKYSATSQAFNSVKSPVYANSAAATYYLDAVGGGANIPVGTVYVESNYDHGNNSTSSLPVVANFQIKRRVAISPTTITSTAHTGTVTISGTSTFQMAVTTPGSLPTPSGYSPLTTITLAGNSLTDFVQAINVAGLANISAGQNANGSVYISHSAGGEILFKDPNGTLGQAGFTPSEYNATTDKWTNTNNFYTAGDLEPTGATHRASNWQPMVLTSSPVSLSSIPSNGQLWYSSIIDQADIMIHDGTTWRGYKNIFPLTDPNGPIVSATNPRTQTDGSPLENGDIWVSTADIERYGIDVYVYDGITTAAWILQDVTDQTSPTGWVFDDARWATNGYDTVASSIKDLATSDFLDPDAPDPAEYPRGMRLWNLRRSGFNVKQYVTNYINIYSNNGTNLRLNEPMDGANATTPYNPNRWVSVSPNAPEGNGTFGRLAQRSFVVSSLKATIDGSSVIRDTDTLAFNLITCPGYPEAIQNLITLNADRAYTGFVIGDTPFRLKSNGTDLLAWGANSNGALDNGDKGAVSRNEYMAMFYPSGYTNDLTGNYIVVPPSHMMLRTIVNSDAKSYPWFAPAGIRRGLVDNATSVGYIENGEFKTTALPSGVRDVMATVAINPIANLSGAGIVNYGQYTRAAGASALDRINVARLVAHLRRQLDVLSRPYLFEPNDKITRTEIKNAVTSLLLELVGQRALYDFIVVCDESNNTPARIDRSELWVDLAIEPVKAVEFIYIPLRIVKTGAIQAGTYSLA